MPMRNDEIARMFEQLADLLEIEGANPFRVRAYKNAARTLRSLPEEAAAILERHEDLSELPTIGKDLAGKIDEIVDTGRLQSFEDLKKKVPAGLAELTRIPGLGPKRVKLLYDKRGIKTPQALRTAASHGVLRGIPGFGARSEQKILDYFKSERLLDKRMLLFEADKTAKRLLEYLSAVAEPECVAVAGSYRRRAETVGDLDIVVASETPRKVMDHFAAFEEIGEVLSKGNTRATVRLRSGLQVDCRVIGKASYGAALVYFTGSKEHGIALRKRAIALGLKINEYGVFKGAKATAGRTEKDVYAAVGLPFIPPELREDRGEIDAADDGRLPSLVTMEDICGDLHVHSTASDGQSTIRDLAIAARKRGHAYIAIADHSKHVRIANGLTASRLERQIDEIEKLNEELSGIRILKSLEVDILADGTLDMPDATLAKLDLVVGAVHFDFELDPAKQTDRIIRAMDHPAFSILAHPTCRLIGERDPMRVEMERLMDAALDRGCFLEANGQPQRLDLNDVHCRMAKERGLKLSLSTDAHSDDQFGLMRLCVGQARRGWIEKSDVINCRPWRELKALLKR